MPAPAVELRGISKRFAHTFANNDVNLKIAAGEIHALAGENGAGKTTLVRILYGMQQPDSGEIFLKGSPVSFRSPADAIAAGIGMVHQHFMLIPAFTVAENIVLGHEPRHAGVGLDRGVAASTIRKLAEQFQLAADPDARAGDLAVGEQQRVEILKLLYRKASILIFDEPSAVLSPAETENLFRVMRGLKEQGKTILLITHKLDEIMAIADRVTIMRRGKIEGERLTSETSPRDLARLMVGRDVDLTPQRTASSPGEAALTARNLSMKRKRGGTALHEVTFDIRRGEILGIAGVEGNGQTELAEILAGVQVPDSGGVTLQTDEVSQRHWHRLRNAVAWIPEDRHKRAIVDPFTLSENLVLGFHRREPNSTYGLLRWKSIAEWAMRLLQKYDVRPPNPKAVIRGLSGGNQQKVVLARELARDSAVIIASQPTRGVDVGAIEFIHRQLLDEKAKGRAILLVSSELSELLALSDRIAVMNKGRIVAILDAATATIGEIGLLMTGGAA